MPPKKARVFDDTVLQSLRDQGLLAYANDPQFVVHWIPTGIPDLDEILNGGYPRRRVSVLAGEYSSGKTFLLQIAMKAAIEAGLSVVYIDAEQTFDPVWWTQVGLPLDKINLSQPSSGEKAAAVAVGAVLAGVDLVVIDSLAALFSAKMADDTKFEKEFISKRAALINRLVETILASKGRSAVVCTNQVRENFANTPGPALEMPGGQGIRHYASLIVRTRRDGWINEREQHVGFNIRALCFKNKVGRPFGECLLPFLFRGEIDMLVLLIERALEHGLVTQAGPYFQIRLGDEEPVKLLGKNTTVDYLKDNPEVLARMRVLLGEEA